MQRQARTGRRYHQWLLLLPGLALIGVMGVLGGTDAQEPATETPVEAPVSTESTVSWQAVEEQLKRMELSTDLDEESKKKVTDLLRRAVDQGKRAELFGTQLGSLEAAAKTVEERVEAFKKRAKEFKDAAPPTLQSEVGTVTSLAELEQLLTKADQRAKELREKVTKADSDVATRAARIKTIRERLIEAKRVVEELVTQGAAVAGDSEQLEDAKQAELNTHRQLLRAEISALEAELALLDAENAADLPRLRRDDASLELAVTEKRLQLIQSAVRSARADEASRQLETTQSEAESETDPLLKRLAERNVEIAQQYQALNESIASAERTLKATRSVRDDWNKEAASTKNQVETIGLTNTTGAMLRQQKLKLPSAKSYHLKVAERNPLVNAAQLTWLQLEEERSQDLDETIRRDDELQEPTSSEIRSEALKLIDRRNELLAPLIRSQNDYFQTLVELSNTEQQIANQIEAYAAFIDERVLWVRSNASLLRSLYLDKSDMWMLDGARWKAAWQSVLVDLGKNVAWYILAATGLAILLRNRILFRSRIRELGTLAESGRCTKFLPTAHTLLLTALAAAPWPALLGFVSWRLSMIAGNNEVVRSLANGCYLVAIAYFPLELFRLACRPNGLAESHFGWPRKSVQLGRRHIRAVMLISLPLVMLMGMFGANPAGLGGDLLERLTFILVTITIAFFLGSILHPQSGVFSAYLARNTSSWATRLQPLWYWLIVLSPLVLTALAFSGYFYTSQQLAWRLFATAILLGCILVTTAFISRMLLVQRRRLSIEQARQRRAAQLQANQVESTTPVTEDLPSAEDLRAQISQSQSLLRTVMVGVALVGIWMAWVDVLPALSFLEQWPLWNSTVKQTEMLTDASGEVSYNTRDVIDPVTIADVVLSLVILALTLVSARNIPGVLEISILQRLPIETSVRYAITTIVSYVIMLLGLIVACGVIGIHWNQVQWMATALTFGLAFGLQEMFANFVAGIIILFERPIRVGDIVTIDDVSGTVSRVQIRATTITNWDRKDYIVPNKDFITGRVLNWTLSDQFNRIVVRVGVAYGSDTNKTLATIRQVAEQHPTVVDNPPPQVTFEEFGDSSLNFTLRCYMAIKDMPSRLQVINELHLAIDAAFRQEKIEIAFPQQDVHIRSTPPETALRLEGLREASGSGTAIPDSDGGGHENTIEGPAIQ